MARGGNLAGRLRPLTVIAQDPSVTDRSGVLTVQVDVPREDLAPGPRGARLHVIDYDASTDTLYTPRADRLDEDPYERVVDRDQLLGDPGFHAQNVYAIVMATLARFEHALGRRAPFALPAGGLGAVPGRGHVMKAAPHAFCEANAFYSRRDEGLLFGYFPIDARRKVFTCLSHDVVAHETTHAILDGLRPRYTDPSSLDQAAFHEGFADIVALLSVMRHARVVEFALGASRGRVQSSKLEAAPLRRSALLGLAEEMGAVGQQLAALRGNALRRSAEIEPDEKILETEEYREPHRRGEVFAAAMMRSFLEVWVKRLRPLKERRKSVDVGRVAEEAAHSAQHLLTMAIRALDYAPPIDLQFGDFLTALLTADREAYPDDSRFRYRDTLVDVFASYGIRPTAAGNWDAPPEVSFARNHAESIRRDPDEMYHFLWHNRDTLELYPDAFTYVASVRPCVRVDADGFTLRETIADYVQLLNLQAGELAEHGVRKPDDMPDSQHVRLNGGGVLVFDEFGRLKYHVATRVNSNRQSDRLQHLWDSGFYGDRRGMRRMAHLHRARAMDAGAPGAERW